MDVNLARTFLMVAETGSFIETARKMNITQSTVSARIKGLEELLGRPLFTRSKSGAVLTAAGELFQKHALAMVRVWQQAQLQVSLADQHPDHISVGAPLSLWSGFLLKWVSGLRSDTPGIAVSASAGLAGSGVMPLLCNPCIAKYRVVRLASEVVSSRSSFARHQNRAHVEPGAVLVPCAMVPSVASVL